MIINSGILARLALLSVAVQAPTWADAILSYTETDVGGSLFRYDYVLQNTFDPVVQPLNLYDIVFSFPDAPSVLALPVGWDFSQLLNSVEAFSLNVGAPPFGTDIPPGDALGGFSFQFGSRIGAIPFTASFSDSTSGGIVVVDGVSTTPIPEPATLWLIGTVLLLVAMVKRRSSRCAGTAGWW